MGRQRASRLDFHMKIFEGENGGVEQGTDRKGIIEHRPVVVSLLAIGFDHGAPSRLTMPLDPTEGLSGHRPDFVFPLAIGHAVACPLARGQTDCGEMLHL